MAITHPKPTEETPTNHGEGTTPSPEKATKKHGKMFKAGAAGLAALGIAGAAFVAGRGSGESEPQKVTNDAPVAESTLPSETTETTKTTETKPTNELLTVTSSGLRVEYGSFLPSADGKLVISPERQEMSRQNQDLKRITEGLSYTVTVEGGKKQASVAMGTCLSYTDTYEKENGERYETRTFYINPLFVEASPNITVYGVREDSASSSLVVENNNGTLRASTAVENLTIDQVSENQRGQVFDIYEEGKPYKDIQERWSKSGYAALLSNSDMDRPIVVGAVVSVIDNGELATNQAARRAVCTELYQHTIGVPVE